MSGRPEVHPGGPSKKPSSLSPPVVYANGLEGAKAARVQAGKLRRKSEAETAGKKIVQVVAPGGGQKKGPASAAASPPRQQTADGQSVGGPSWKKSTERARATAGTESVSSIAETRQDTEPLGLSGQAGSAISRAAVAPAAVPERDSPRGDASGGAQSIGGAKPEPERARERVPAEEERHELGTGPAAHSAKRGSFVGLEERLPPKGVSSAQRKLQQEVRQDDSQSSWQKAPNRTEAASSAKPQLQELPLEDHANGAVDVARVRESEGTGSAEELGSLTFAHQRIQELLSQVSPKKSADARRRAIVHFVHNLINNCFPAAVSTFGSVPLKTYLPDGDIDVVAFAHSQPFPASWANDVRAALDREERKQRAEFRVREVQFIQAEVKLIKCLIENIVVDISFNQLSGICTLCFLEVVDREIAREHLFKRSVILVKAWCYYESRILGAHHGLISTYALETLVLYTFQVFHASLHGPLDVLYRFLSFFSSFDWDRNCLSLRGVIPLASLPSLKAEAPVAELGGSLLLSEGFLARCVDQFAVIPEGEGADGTGGRHFVAKAMNIQDPLLYYNNLGRSVSKGNLSRIRTALKKGAATLGGILRGPSERLLPDLDRFFANTWCRHGTGDRPDVPETRPRAGQQRALAATSHQASNGLKGYLGGGTLATGRGAESAGGAGLQYAEGGAPSSGQEMAEPVRVGNAEGGGRYMGNGSADEIVLDDEAQEGLLNKPGGRGLEHLKEQHVDNSRGEVQSSVEDSAVGHGSGAKSRVHTGKGTSGRGDSSSPRHRQEGADGPHRGISRAAESSLQSTPSSSPRAGAGYPLSYSSPSQLFERKISGSVVEGVPAQLPYFSGVRSGTGAFLPSPDLQAVRVPSPSEPATGLPYWKLLAEGSFGTGPLPGGTPLERGRGGRGELRLGGAPRLVGDIPIPIANPEDPSSPKGASRTSTSISPPLFPVIRTPPGGPPASGQLHGYEQFPSLPPAAWMNLYNTYANSNPAEGLPGAVPFPPPLQLPDPAGSPGAEGYQTGTAGSSVAKSEQSGTFEAPPSEDGQSNGRTGRTQGGEQHKSREASPMGSIRGEGYHRGEESRPVAGAPQPQVGTVPNGVISWGQFADLQNRQLLSNGYSAGGLQLYQMYNLQRSGTRSGAERRGAGWHKDTPTGDSWDEEGSRNRGAKNFEAGQKERVSEVPVRSGGTSVLDLHAKPLQQREMHAEGVLEGQGRETAAEMQHQRSRPEFQGRQANGPATQAAAFVTLERKTSMERGSKGGSGRQAWVAKGGEVGRGAQVEDAVRDGKGEGARRSQERGVVKEGSVGEHLLEEGSLDGQAPRQESYSDAGGDRIGAGLAEAGVRGRGGTHRRQFSEGSIDFQGRQAPPFAALADMQAIPLQDLPSRPVSGTGSLSLPSANGAAPLIGLPSHLALPPGSLPTFPTYLFPSEPWQGGAHIPPGEARMGAAQPPDPRGASRTGGFPRLRGQEEDELRQLQSLSRGDPAQIHGVCYLQQPVNGYPSPFGFAPYFYPPVFSWEAGGGFSLAPSTGVGVSLPSQQAPTVASDSADSSGPSDDGSGSDEDLLEGDLDTHLRSLEFGRHCQAQVDRGQKWQPPLPPPQATPGPPPVLQSWNHPPAPAQKSQPRSSSYPSAGPPHMYGPTLRSPQGGPNSHWQHPQQQHHKYGGKGQRSDQPLGMQRHGEEAFRQQRGAAMRSSGAFLGPGGRLYMPQGQAVGVHFLDGDARQPTDLFNRGNMGPSIPRVRSADSYSSEGLHLDPRTTPRYLDARMQSPRLARIPTRVLPSDFRLPHYAMEERHDAQGGVRGGRESVDRPEWQAPVGNYFQGGNMSPHMKPTVSGYHPNAPLQFPMGARLDHMSQNPHAVYSNAPQQSSSGFSDISPQSLPRAHGGPGQDSTAATPKLRSINEGEERDLLPRRPSRGASYEETEGWEHTLEPGRGRESQAGEGEEEGAGRARELERSEKGAEQEAGEGDTPGPEGSQESRESSQQFSEEDFPPLSMKTKPGTRSKVGLGSPRLGKGSPKSGGT